MVWPANWDRLDDPDISVYGGLVSAVRGHFAHEESGSIIPDKSALAIE